MPQESNFSPKIEFTNASDTSSEDQNDYEQGMEIAKKGLTTYEKIHSDENGFSVRNLNEQEKQTVERYITGVHKALDALGLSEFDSWCPNINEIYFIQSKDVTEPGGDVEAPLHQLRIIMPEEMDINDEKIEGAFYHESSHFITKILVSLKKIEDAPIIKVPEDTDPWVEDLFASFNIARKESLRDTLRGFHDDADTSFLDRKTTDKQLARGFLRFDWKNDAQLGILEEGPADLFALYCIGINHPNEERTFVGTYGGQTPAIAAFLQKYAELKGDGYTFENAFSDLLKAKMTRNFSYFKDLIDTFSKLPEEEVNIIIEDPATDYIKIDSSIVLNGRARALMVATLINNIESMDHHITFKGFKDLSQMAEAGGFQDQMWDYLRPLHSEQKDSVKFADLPVSYKIRTDTID